jgi:hypothetical protein
MRTKIVRRRPYRYVTRKSVLAKATEKASVKNKSTSGFLKAAVMRAVRDGYNPHEAILDIEDGSLTLNFSEKEMRELKEHTGKKSPRRITVRAYIDSVINNYL